MKNGTRHLEFISVFLYRRKAATTEKEEATSSLATLIKFAFVITCWNTRGVDVKSLEFLEQNNNIYSIYPLNIFRPMTTSDFCTKYIRDFIFILFLWFYSDILLLKGSVGFLSVNISFKIQ